MTPPRPAGTPGCTCDGYRARIPHDDVVPGTPWVAAMRTTLMAILAQADGLALLPWKLSRGACLEERVARSLGMPVMTVDEWLHFDDESASRPRSTHP